MKLLLDTHAFLWFFIGDTSLSARARALIEDESNDDDPRTELENCRPGPSLHAQ